MFSTYWWHEGTPFALDVTTDLIFLKRCISLKGIHEPVLKSTKIFDLKTNSHARCIFIISYPNCDRTKSQWENTSSMRRLPLYRQSLSKTAHSYCCLTRRHSERTYWFTSVFKNRIERCISSAPFRWIINTNNGNQYTSWTLLIRVFAIWPEQFTRCLSPSNE